MWCAFAISLLAVDVTGALSVESVVKTVTSATKLNESEDSKANDSPRGADKAGDNSRPVTVPSSDTATPVLAPTPQPAAPVVVEPLEQLPSIAVTETPPKTVIMYRPAASLAVSQRVVMGASNDTITPLQASDQGWKLFNIAWYWWALIVTIGYYLVRQSKYLHYRRTVKDLTVN